MGFLSAPSPAPTPKPVDTGSKLEALQAAEALRLRRGKSRTIIASALADRRGTATPTMTPKEVLGG
jgi:hypothetical protein